jgi:hypothetical protein
MGLAMLAHQRTLSSINEVGIFAVHSHEHYTLLRLDGRRWLFQNSLERTPLYLEDGAIGTIVADMG